MAKITLDTIVSGFKSVSRLATNFSLIQDTLNNKVLYRDNPTGEPNQMENVLDMNSNRIINLPNATSSSEPITLAQLDQRVTLKEYLGTSIEVQTAVEGQTLFNLAQAYTPAANSLFIFINGVKQTPSAYSETSPTSVTFSEPLNENDTVEFIINLFLPLS